MRQISLMKDLHIVRGSIEDYRRLSVYHYRDCRIGPYSDIYAIRHKTQDPRLKTQDTSTGSGVPATNNQRPSTCTAGVIVYSMPPLGLELRNVALGGALAKMDLKSRFRFINKNIRTISRVIIEPRFRSIGLAQRLVRETMEMADVPIIEALAVMGQINNFFERAGMTAYKGEQPIRCVQMIEAFDYAGVNKSELIDTEAVQKKIDRLHLQKQRFINEQMRKFLRCYGKRRAMPPGIERTRFVLSRLGDRPVYYIKIKHKKLKIKVKR